MKSVNMKRVKAFSGLLFFIIGCLFLLTSWNGFQNIQTSHKFYISVSQLSFSKKDQSFQITTRVFIDDLNDLLKNRYSIDAYLGTEKEHPSSQKFINSYFNDKMQIRLDGKNIPLHIIGHKKDNDVFIYYTEAKVVDFEKVNELEVYCSFLTDLFEEQQNVFHLKLRGVKKSFLLMKDSPLGVLNFN
jgi:hypothetical protein